MFHESHAREIAVDDDHEAAILRSVLVISVNV